MQEKFNTIEKMPKKLKKLSYSHILITGASSGIGLALARYYANKALEDADRIVYLSLTGRDSQRLKETAHSCQNEYVKVCEYIFDVTDFDITKQTILKANEICPLDLVIANAGISGGGGDDCEEYEQAYNIFQTNIFGVINTISPAIEVMSKSGKGQIAIISSIAGFRGWPGAPAYCASKSAVKTYGESLRSQMKKTGIKINVVCPGFIKTPMTGKNGFPMPFIMEKERAAKIIAQGLEKDKTRIAFPWQLVSFAWFFSVIPDRLAHFLLKNTPSKPKL